MRFFPALLGALLITTAVFLFMQSLIEGQQRNEIPVTVFDSIEVFREKPKPEEKPPEKVPEETPEPEPEMAELAPSPLPSMAKTQLQMPALDLDMGDIKVDAVGNQWGAPLSGSGAESIAQIIDGHGSDAQGFIEIIPFSTRKPSVPELAWRNKISGWVLVAFNLTPEGETRNVRVLDASPRGVFEEKVLSAVGDWRYSIRSKGPVPRNLAMTQKVEVQWEDYPMNIPNVD
jgi:TonB family protein